MTQTLHAAEVRRAERPCTRPGTALRTSFGADFTFTLDDNGPFTMTFTLKDRDSGITRTYADTIQIEAKRPCA